MKILLIAEHDNHTLKSANLHSLTAATLLNGEIDVFVAGFNCDRVIHTVASWPSVQRVRVANVKEYQYQLPENIAPLIADIGHEYDVILTQATTFGKNILPRVAALLDTVMLSDVIKIIDNETFVRPIYAGNALATIRNQAKIKILTIRTTGFPATNTIADNKAIIESIIKIIPNNLSEFVDHTLTVSERPELTNARIVVSGGRGLKSAENFKTLEAFADSIGAAIGASRAAVDAGFAPNDYQVGQTGKIVAPDLYIAVGISGAIQHLAGMKDSKVIVAINSDPDAPIFQAADYGLVGDLFKILPELKTELSG